MIEIWKDIKGYEGEYQVSNFGRIKSLKYGKQRIMAMAYDRDGYLIMHLTKNDKRKNIRVHRIVAEAFIPNPNKLEQINHKDENKENNIVDNLEWCDCRYNLSYGSRMQKVIDKRSIKITQYTKEGNPLKIWDSMASAARELGVDVSAICSCCRGRLKTYKGYLWKYAS